jgi:hypothetical protein
MASTVARSRGSSPGRNLVIASSRLSAFRTSLPNGPARPSRGLLVELLGLIHVGHRDHDGLELHAQGRGRAR